jgi:hypothetical protein
MKEEVYSLVPQWLKEAKQGQYSIMVGDDIDSLTTASVLNQVFGWEINWFYDFHKVYVLDKDNKLPRVGCDMALEKGQKTIDNHVTLLHKDDKRNQNSVNMNVMYGIHRGIYTQKYAMSTLMLAWSLLGLPLPETDEGKMIFLSIDSAFLGHFNERFKPIHNEWLRKLGFEELIDFLDIKQKRDFYNTIDEYGLSKKIYLSEKDGQLKHTGIDFEAIGRLLGIEIQLPEGSFELVQELHRGNCNLNEFQKKSKGKPLKKNQDVFSFALTYRDVASFTMV